MSVFEKIIKNEIPSYKVYDDDEFIAILDVNPKQTGHTLVIPKSRKSDVLEESDEMIKNLFCLSRKISKHLLENLGATGIKLTSNIGRSAGQEVFHTHVHLIPYYDDEREVIVSEDILKTVVM